MPTKEGLRLKQLFAIGGTSFAIDALRSSAHPTALTGDPVSYQIPNPAGGEQMETFIPWTLVKRGVKKQVITPIDAPEHFREEAAFDKEIRKAEQDSPLVRALGLAYYWQSMLDEGKYRSMTEIAAAEGMDLGRASQIVRLTRLAPEIVEACLVGENNRMALVNLNRRGLPVDWSVQRLMLLTPMADCFLLLHPIPR